MSVQWCRCREPGCRRSCWRRWPGEWRRRSPRRPCRPAVGEGPDFLTAGQLAERLGVSRETVRRLAIADVLPCTVVCGGSRKTTRRYPRRFADDFAASGQDTSDLAEFAARWRAQMTAAAPGKAEPPHAGRADVTAAEALRAPGLGRVRRRPTRTCSSPCR